MNKVEKIKADIDRLQETTMDENRNFLSSYHEGIFDGLSMIENFIDSPEESVKRTTADMESAMQEVEDKSKAFTAAHPNGFDISFGEADSELGNDLEEAAWTYYDKNKPLIPHELDLHKELISFFIVGAQWQKEQMIDKACEWIKYNNENGGCLFDGWEDDFKKYMEG